jgi:hypothetical protein
MRYLLPSLKVPVDPATGLVLEKFNRGAIPWRGDHDGWSADVISLYV